MQKEDGRTRRGGEKRALSTLRTQEKPQMELPANTQKI